MLLYNLFVLSSVLLSSGHAVNLEADLGLSDFGLNKYNKRNTEKEDALRESFLKYFKEHCNNGTLQLNYDHSVYHYLHDYLFWWTRVYPNARIFYSFISKWPKTEKTWSQIGKEHIEYITSYHLSKNTNKTCEVSKFDM
ncbi:unnamed protein product [Cylicocyclus nassatus]|uniref:Uncharacterized protein n=1 Tax=Cylicocyclus nassatus TaxID=53992 RepID=A0AA36GTH8_CYLNA|nr:unnamed protein product [Cylicocyclus nassatus]